MDYTTTYDMWDGNRMYAKGKKYLAGSDLYMRTGESLIIPDYDSNIQYNKGDIVYDTSGGLVNRAVAGKDEVYKRQPVYYSATQTQTMRFGDMTSRYNIVFEYDDMDQYPFYGFTREIDAGGRLTVTHRLFRDYRSSTKWSYQVSWEDQSFVEEVYFYTTLDNDAPELPAVPLDRDDPDYKWMGKTFIRNSEKIYMRSPANVDVETAVNHTNAAFIPEFQPDRIPGFVYVEPENMYRCVDNKKYTKTIGNRQYEGFGLSPTTSVGYDIVALCDVICERIEVDFRENDGTVHTVVHYPNNEIDPTLPQVPATALINSPLSAPSLQGVYVALYGDVIQLGSAYLGATLHAGFTNLAITNKYEDFSPNETDAWGNIYYKDGVRARTFSGTVDIDVTDYDKINKLMLLLGQTEVIINASDGDAADLSAKDVFESTMLVGRLKEISLATKVTNKRLSDTSTWNFKFRESI
jgi:hypothetical protein